MSDYPGHVSTYTFSYSCITESWAGDLRLVGSKFRIETVLERPIGSRGSEPEESKFYPDYNIEIGTQ